MGKMQIECKMQTADILHSACILPLVCSLHFTPSLQSVFYTDHIKK